jgi:hypothetical protein
MYTHYSDFRKKPLRWINSSEHQEDPQLLIIWFPIQGTYLRDLVFGFARGMHCCMKSCEFTESLVYKVFWWKLFLIYIQFWKFIMIFRMKVRLYHALISERNCFLPFLCLYYGSVAWLRVARSFVLCIRREKKEQGSGILFVEGDDGFGISGFSWNYDVLLNNVTQSSIFCSCVVDRLNVF